MTRTISLAAAVAFVGLASAALAADQNATFESLDRNADGKISLSEAASNDKVFVAFKSLDADKDGSLTKDEFSQHQGPSPET